MSLIYIELTRLVDDYFKCDTLQIKEQILSDIRLLTEAVLSENPQ